MAKILKLEIRNFRGIKDNIIRFNNESMVCLIGRGDSGKSTIIEAISRVLSPRWNLIFHDTDFYNCDYNTPIEIVASLTECPDKLRSDEKFGLYLDVIDPTNGEILPDITSEEAKGLSTCILTIKLTIDKSLEPKWTVISSREQEEKPISAIDRALFNCYMVSDYLDSHFYWSKGNPLYGLLKTTSSPGAEDISVILDQLREAKRQIDEHIFENLSEVTDLIKNQSSNFGLDISSISTTIDSKELSSNGDRISLHADNIPIRLKGKGSKRLTSFAIQSALLKDGGIMLVDEIEQGLEPDRVKHLVRELKDQNEGQIFLTTHSREVITELTSKHFLLVLKEKNGPRVKTKRLEIEDAVLQGVVRACPEAFFATRVIVCEGKTEVGICRAIDKYRRLNGSEPMSFSDCAYVNGQGNPEMFKRAKEIVGTDIRTALLCDSDWKKKKQNDDAIEQKKLLTASNVSIFDCENGKCIEHQVFSDLSWQGILEILDYVGKNHRNGNTESLIQSINSSLPAQAKLNTDWPLSKSDSEDLRVAIAKASITLEWFKRIDHGEFLGDTIFRHFGKIQETHLGKMLKNLTGWIDK